MMVSVDMEKVFGNIQYLFLIKFLNKLGLERDFSNLIKAIYNKTYN